MLFFLTVLTTVAVRGSGQWPQTVIALFFYGHQPEKFSTLGISGKNKKSSWKLVSGHRPEIRSASPETRNFCVVAFFPAVLTPKKEHRRICTKDGQRSSFVHVVFFLRERE